MEQALLLYILVWTGLSFLVAEMGRNKQVGYKSVLLASILLSPVIGFIVAVVSPSVNASTGSVLGGDRYKVSLDNAKKAVFKGQIQEAISLYEDTLYYLHNDYKNVKGTAGMNRMDLISNIEKKVQELKDKLVNQHNNNPETTENNQ